MVNLKHKKIELPRAKARGFLFHRKQLKSLDLKLFIALDFLEILFLFNINFEVLGLTFPPQALTAVPAAVLLLYLVLILWL